MTATLVARGLAAAHGDRLLFSDLDLTVGSGDVIGLVGANGAGKSTLLRMLAGLSAAESGAVAISPPTATIGYLAQEPDRLRGPKVLLDGKADRRPHRVLLSRVNLGEGVVHPAVAGQEVPAQESRGQGGFPHLSDL